MDWKPANMQEVLTAIEADWVGIDPALMTRLATYLVEPQSALVERFGRVENAFIVARINRHVVFFDDIEEEFCTAKEAAGKLWGVESYGNVAVALSELERLGSSGS